MDFQVRNLFRFQSARGYASAKLLLQEVMMFLQALPTKDWTEKDIELLLSEAFIWQSLFQGSRAHLRPSGEQPPDDGGL